VRCALPEDCASNGTRFRRARLPLGGVRAGAGRLWEYQDDVVRVLRSAEVIHPHRVQRDPMVCETLGVLLPVRVGTTSRAGAAKPGNFLGHR
jgi:hypothetical protein